MTQINISGYEQGLDGFFLVKSVDFRALAALGSSLFRTAGVVCEGRIFLTAWLLCLAVGSAFLVGCEFVNSDQKRGADARWDATDSTQTVMKAVAQYRLRRIKDIGGGTRTWQHCTFFTGMMAAYESTGAPAYLQSVLRWGEANDWTLGSRKRHADDQCVGQAYLDVYRLSGAERHLQDTEESFDRVLAAPKTGREEWYWVRRSLHGPPCSRPFSGDHRRPKVLDPSVQLLLERNRPLVQRSVESLLSR